MLNTIKIFIVCVAFFSVMLFEVNIFSQNKSYAVIYDTINVYLSDSNYNDAKRRFELLLKEDIVDPAERLLFSRRALEFDDVNYFKAESIILMRDFGWHYSYQDTLIEGTNTEQIKKHGLVKWLVKKSEIYYPEWIKKNPTGYLVQEEVEKILAMDHTRIFFYHILYGTAVYDSTTTKCVQTELDNLDYSNILAIVSICQKYGLPNNFEHGYNTYYQITLLMLHSMSHEVNIKRVWSVLFPFLERAYFDGKISYTFFYLYDTCLFKATGYQYYGTMNIEIPIIDSDNVYERKKKYSL
ncbi:MAG: hypothetical protein IPM74_02250 [Crocinitomicaceae bacterium]|nr:hypothetical protein [Crocinitomicaceae bacterium]MBK8924738.1 hypothetical protein [Crocinitomicaceae bacterium]